MLETNLFHKRLSRGLALTNLRSGNKVYYMAVHAFSNCLSAWAVLSSSVINKHGNNSAEVREVDPVWANFLSHPFRLEDSHHVLRRIKVELGDIVTKSPNGMSIWYFIRRVRMVRRVNQVRLIVDPGGMNCISGLNGQLRYCREEGSPSVVKELTQASRLDLMQYYCPMLLVNVVEELLPCHAGLAPHND